MKYLLKTSLSLATILLCGVNAHAATVYQANTNAYTIDDARSWSNNEAPSAGNDYIANLTELKTLSSSGVFAGDSLKLTGNGNLALKQSTGNVYTVNNLILDGGRIKNTAGNNAVTLDGNILLAAGSSNAFSASTGNRGTIIIRSDISGAGSVVINTFGAVNFTNSNSYLGGTIVEQGEMIVQSASGLGKGAVDVRSGASLTLRSVGAIDASALLILADVAQANLDFTGSSAISGLSFDGGLTFVAAGTWGSVGSGAQFESSQFRGNGILTVVPESSSVSLALASLALGACYCMRKKSQRGKRA